MHAIDQAQNGGKAVQHVPSVAVVIASVGRPTVLHETVLSVLSQRLMPSEVVISVPGPEHVDPRTPLLPGVRCITSPKGSCVQRNRGAASVARSVDLLAFFDDDVELDPEYLAVMARVFARNPDIVVANGQLVADGGPRHAMSRPEARAILDATKEERAIEREWPVTRQPRLYGCHFAVRRSVFDTVQFDERMPLYGWLEDVDFGRRCERLGRVCQIGGARVVHLAERSGRTSGLRFGYSQIMNPAYMRTKGTFSGLECWSNWSKAFVSNLSGLILLKRVKRERLHGNLLAAGHAVRGRIDPEYITRL